jgi:hypothetical protein
VSRREPKGARRASSSRNARHIFTNNVANIGPHETIAVQIEYQESLRFDHGRYQMRVPLVVAPRFSPSPAPVLAQFTAGSLGLVRSDPVPDRDRLVAPVVRPEWGKINPVSLTVNLEAGFPLGDVASDSHKLSIVRNGTTAASVGLTDGDVPSDRDFTFSFAPAAGAAPVASLLKEHFGDSDYLLALVVPPGSETRSKVKPREAIFILDNSGSMAGESIREARASLLLALERLSPADRFNVIRFDDTMTVFFPSPVDATPDNVARAKAYVATIEARGGDGHAPGTTRGAERSNAGRPHAVAPGDLPHRRRGRVTRPSCSTRSTKGSDARVSSPSASVRRRTPISCRARRKAGRGTLHLYRCRRSGVGAHGRAVRKARASGHDRARARWPGWHQRRGLAPIRSRICTMASRWC